MAQTSLTMPPGVQVPVTGSPLILSLPLLTEGQVFIVDSTHAQARDTASHGTIDRPFATWDFAIGRCTANNGDKIYLAPNHAETIIAAGGVAYDIAGVETIGLGVGNSRPRITFGTVTGASVLITAASAKIRNIIGIGNLDALTQPFDVRAADCELDIEWQDTSATVEAARAVLTTAAADRLKIRLKYRGFTGGDAVVNAIRLVGVDGADIYIEAFGVCTTAWVEFVTTACTNVRVEGILFTQGITTGARNVVDTIGGSTWSADLFDASAGQSQSGGSAKALAVNDHLPKTVVNTTAVLANATTIFTIAGGPIEILALVARCVTGNDATASTLQWSADPTDGAAVTFSGASASLANALAGATVVLQGTTLATAPLVNASGVGLGQQVTNGIIVAAGIITTTIGVGSTTGTWQHHLYYRPLAPRVTVS